MTFEEEPRRPPAEPFVPMINVVFLLLIFFLMTAQITPPPPFETEPPVASKGADPGGEAVLHLSPDGSFGFAEVLGDDAVAEALAAVGGGPLRLRADGGMEGAALAAALKRLSARGVERIELVTTAGASKAGEE
ncbi:MAG: biopolymer transporter ExbD [Pseudomonadota bacterium]